MQCTANIGCCSQVFLFLALLSGPALSSPIISPAALIRSLRSLASNIGRRNAQYQYNSGGFSDGTDFGNTFVNFGVSSIAPSGSYDSLACSTVYEEQCNTIEEQQCQTVNENQCR